MTSRPAARVSGTHTRSCPLLRSRVVVLAHRITPRPTVTAPAVRSPTWRPVKADVGGRHVRRRGRRVREPGPAADGDGLPSRLGGTRGGVVGETAAVHDRSRGSDVGPVTEEQGSVRPRGNHEGPDGTRLASGPPVVCVGPDTARAYWARIAPGCCPACHATMSSSRTSVTGGSSGRLLME